ncbi:hypothetical protein EXN66_Car010428 [Channa argus]|uniref:Uncharacterized protein n=1 Tax=Channa argus TaxID=215402 RepID=A0A6G1PWW6_CHAAH|nr:hypothetical protein EXN66_Car010428 [Channa argus]
MGFCIDPQDRKQNYCDNRERLRKSEKREIFVYITFGGGRTGGWGRVYMCGGKTQKVWCGIKCDRPYLTTATDHCQGSRLNLLYRTLHNFFSVSCSKQLTNQNTQKYKIIIAE